MAGHENLYQIISPELAGFLPAGLDINPCQSIYRKLYGGGIMTDLEVTPEQVVRQDFWCIKQDKYPPYWQKLFPKNISGPVYELHLIQIGEAKDGLVTADFRRELVFPGRGKKRSQRYINSASISYRRFENGQHGINFQRASITMPKSGQFSSGFFEPPVHRLSYTNDGVLIGNQPLLMHEAGIRDRLAAETVNWINLKDPLSQNLATVGPFLRLEIQRWMKFT